MTDNDIIKIFLPLVKNGMAAYGYTVGVRQSYQPTAQGADDEATLYFFKVGDQRIGQPKRQSVWNALAGKFTDTDTQRIEATFQINALVRQVPAATTMQPTAADYLNVAAMVMQTENFVESLRAAGIAILKIGEVRNPYFKDDRDQYEAMPSFDFTIVYNRTLVRDGRAIESITFEVDRV